MENVHFLRDGIGSVSRECYSLIGRKERKGLCGARANGFVVVQGLCMRKVRALESGVAAAPHMKGRLVCNSAELVGVVVWQWQKQKFGEKERGTLALCSFLQ